VVADLVAGIEERLLDPLLGAGRQLGRPGSPAGSSISRVPRAQADARITSLSSSASDAASN